MYRIMLVNKEGSNEINNLYKFFTVVNTDGQPVIFEAETLEALDAQVEKMINGNYRKKDILVVQTKGFDISANIYEAGAVEEQEPDSATDPDTETP